MGDLTENNAQSQSEQIKKNTAKHKEHEIQQAKRVQTYVENNVKEKQNPNEFNGICLRQHGTRLVLQRKILLPHADIDEALRIRRQRSPSNEHKSDASTKHSAYFCED